MNISARIEELRPEIEALCRRLAVRQLYLFGSAAGEGFSPERSDLDFLVELDVTEPGYADRYFELQEALQSLFGRPVDLVTVSSLSNPYFRASVEETRRLVFAA